MSTRFGRNRRRRAREELAALNVELARSNEALTSANRTLRREAEAVRRLRAKIVLQEVQFKAANEALGPSVVLPPIDELVSPEEFSRFLEEGRWGGIRMMELMRGPLSLDDFSVDSDSTMSYCYDYTMDLIEGGIELMERRGLHRSPHAYVRTARGDILYRVNLESLAQVMTDEGVNRIAHMLATSFIEDVKRITGATSGKRR